MDFNFTIILYIIFGILPSLTWLFYYLRKDVHPEPKRMIINIFLWGAIITLPVLFVQLGFKEILDQICTKFLGLPVLDNFINLPLSQLNFSLIVVVAIYWFLIIAVSEEFFKYLVIRMKVTNSHHLDEPLDIMLYMVVAALGFAAVENVLYLFVPVVGISFNDLVTRTVLLSFVRFIGATFLHTLCSATVGYYLAISFCEAKKKKLYFIGGLSMAVVLHGIYDFSIMTLEGPLKIAIPVIILIILAFLVFSEFEKLKKMKGICKLK